MKSLTKSVSALAITAMLVGGAVTTTLIATPDVAYAKGNGGGNGNGGDNGNGGGNGNSGGNGNGADKGNKGGNSDKSSSGSSARSGGSGNGKLFGIFSVGKKKEQAAPTKTTAAPNPATAKKEARLVAGMHPSQLGSMNGAFNANINAVLAHIRNGNTNGPVGSFAALVAADAVWSSLGLTVSPQDVLDLKEQFETLSAALMGDDTRPTYATIEDYYAALGDIPVQDIEDLLVDGALTTEVITDDAGVVQDNQALLNTALSDAGYTSLDDYQSSVAGTGGERDPTLDAAITALGGDTATRTGISAVEPTEEEVAAADGVIGAEGGIEEAWNKSETGDKAGLLTGLRSRFITQEEQTAIDDAIAAAESTEVVVATE